MIKFLRIVICFFPLLLIHGPLSANQVSGLYDPPVRSVKFGRDSSFSVMPVGWSREGHAAFFILNRDALSAELLIVDTVDDSLLFRSGFIKGGETGFSGIWHGNRDSFSARLSEASIIPDENPLYGGTGFAVENDIYSLYRETGYLAGNSGIAGVDLYIRSENRGTKNLYSYIRSGEGTPVLSEFKVLGYFQSPWEKRIAVVSEEVYFAENGDKSPGLRFSGAHLTIGFRREVSSDKKLVDAVLSGQVYTSGSLLADGADPDQKTGSGIPLVIMAARGGNWDLVFLLARHGADLAVVDGHRRTLLHLAALSGRESVVLGLLELGLNRQFRDAGGKTPADLASEAGYEHLKDILSR